MKEGPHIPERALEGLELDAAADTHQLMNLDVAEGGADMYEECIRKKKRSSRR